MQNSEKINYMEIIKACTLSYQTAGNKEDTCLKILKKHIGKDKLDPNNFLKDNGKDTWTPLQACCWIGFTEGVNFLLKQGANPNIYTKDGKSPLSFSITKNKISIIATLIKHGANINYTDNQGKTALMDACEKGNLTVVKLLLAHNADVQVKNKESKTCHDYCSDSVIKGHLDHHYFNKLLGNKGETKRTKI